jgi:NADH-quinone oxidoreductase subunit D
VTRQGGGSSRSGALAGAARLDLHREVQRLDLGPHHPAARGALGLLAELDGERILDLQVEIGYGHRGFEAQAERLGWHRILPYVERLQSQSSMLVATAYCLAVEKMLGVDVPLRSQWLRVLGGELGRAADHLGRIACLAGILGAGAPSSWALDARARLWGLLEKLSGAPTMHHFIRLGGVAAPLPGDFGVGCRRAIVAVRRDLDDLDAVLGQNRVFIDRLRGRAKLSADQCLAFGVTGPLLRAAGVASDVRRSEAYLVYDELVFDLPVGLVGDNLDRYRVCLEEIYQSLGMVDQCVTRLEALGPGEVRAFDPWLDRDLEGTGPASLDERIALAHSYAAGPRVPEGEGTARVESANGEFGFFLVADGGPTPRRVRCRAPSFFHAQALSAMLVGQTLADLGPTLALANIESAECDR